MANRKNKNINLVSVKTLLTTNKEDFKSQLSERIRIGKELHDRRIQNLDELSKLKVDYDNWNDLNSEILKYSFNKENTDYRRNYDNCAQFIGLEVFFSGQRKPDTLTSRIENCKRNIEAKLTNLTQLLAKVDLIPSSDKTKVIESQVVQELTRNVFIIHGHDEARLLELENLLKDDFKLNPYVLKKLPNNGSSTIIEKFEYYAPQCSLAIALFTPDDIIEKEGKKYLQARPNVIYELGWFCRHLSRKNVILLLKDGTDVFSDFQGILQIRFQKEIVEKYRDLMIEFRSIGLLS